MPTSQDAEGRPGGLLQLAHGLRLALAEVVFPAEAVAHAFAGQQRDGRGEGGEAAGAQVDVAAFRGAAEALRADLLGGAGERGGRGVHFGNRELLALEDQVFGADQIGLLDGEDALTGQGEGGGENQVLTLHVSCCALRPELAVAG